MAELTVRMDVEAPAATAWAALTDWGRQGEWMLGTTVWSVHGAGHEVGAELEAFTGIGRAGRGLGFLDRMQVTSWDPPRQCDVLHHGRLIRGTGTFAVQERGTGSTVIWSEDLDLPLGALGRAGWPLVEPAARWGVRRSLARFARWARDYPAGSSAG